MLSNNGLVLDSTTLRTYRLLGEYTKIPYLVL
jgi:hypothetical protein